MKHLNFQSSGFGRRNGPDERLAIHIAGKFERLRLNFLVSSNNFRLPSTAIEGIARWQVGLPTGQLHGQEVTPVKAC
jgi:hypothetical protein